MSLSEFWTNLVGRVAFLLCVLPLFGAAMVAASAGLGREIVRRTALTNALLTAALSAVMVASYDPDAQNEDGDPALVQMATHLPWIGETGPADGGGADPVEGNADANQPFRRIEVSVTLGVDGLNLWPIAAACWLMLAAVFTGTEVDNERPAAFYTTLLLLQSLLIATFAALDAMLFVLCAEISVLPLWYLVGRWGGPDRQTAARKLFGFLLAGGLAAFVGLVGMAVAAAAGDAPRAIIRFDVPRLLSQPAVAGWIAAALVLGLWVRAAIFPVHTWFPAAFGSAPTTVRILLAGLVVPTGIYGLARFVLPLVTIGSGPEPLAPVAESVQMLAIAGAVWCGLLAVAQSELGRLLAYAVLCQTALATAGLTSGNQTGASGGLLHLFHLGIAAAAVSILLGWLDREFASRDLRTIGGLARTRPRFAATTTLGALSLICVAGLGGFPGLLFTVWGVAEGPAGDPRLARAAACLVAAFLCTWAVVAMLVRILFGAQREPVAFPWFRSGPAPSAPAAAFPIRPHHSPTADLASRDLATLVPLALLMLWIGIWPRFFTARIEPAIAQFAGVSGTAEHSSSVAEPLLPPNSGSSGPGNAHVPPEGNR